MVRALSIWLGFVAATSAFGTYQAFFLPHNLELGTFHLAGSQLTPLTNRLFGCWTLLATAIRLTCALDVTNKSVYRVTLFTFLVALGFFTHEVFVAKTVPIFPQFMGPFSFASISALWMMLFPPKPDAPKKNN
jgi:hypothetical protein